MSGILQGMHRVGWGYVGMDGRDVGRSIVMKIRKQEKMSMSSIHPPTSLDGGVDKIRPILAVDCSCLPPTVAAH